VVGKFCALLLMFGGVLLLMFLPGLVAGSPIRELIALYLETLLLAATFLACGLAAGYFAHDRAQGLIVGVSVWLLLLFGLDLVALFAARWSAIQSVPDLWVALLMFNPLDSFRINALFALQQIPAEAANKTALASWWIGHASVWFVVIAGVWSLMLVMLAGLRLKNWEE
jgi:ABC-type transport system involved in multi-copper enzyme maturation permease subunit